MAFDMLTMLQIDLIACRMAIEANPDVAPVETINDEIIGRAIAEYFSDCGEWSDDLLEAAMAEYHKARDIERVANSLVAGVMSKLMPTYADAW